MLRTSKHRVTGTPLPPHSIALVVRGARQVRIAGREVVPGDAMVLAEGDRVPADGTLLWSAHLEVDESLLTGESMPVRKGAPDAAVFSGTLVVHGRGIATVEQTGASTELGKIGKSLKNVITPDAMIAMPPSAAHTIDEYREYFRALAKVT